MNIIDNCTVEYITANRTIETVSIKNTGRFFYIYNYKGNHFRLFTELLDLINFFQFKIEPDHAFLSELELEDYIENYKWS